MGLSSQARQQPSATVIFRVAGRVPGPFAWQAAWHVLINERRGIAVEHCAWQARVALKRFDQQPLSFNGVRADLRKGGPEPRPVTTLRSRGTEWR